MKGAGHVTCMGQIKNVYTILVGKPEGKRPIFEDRQNDNIKIDLGKQGLGCEKDSCG